jgi:hypothetical protein
MIAEIEEAIVSALRESEVIDFNDSSIMIATDNIDALGALVASGGITVQYGGSTLTQPLANGVNIRRQLLFVVSVGRKGLTDKRRLTDDIESVVSVLTSQRIGDSILTWRDDRFAQVRNGVFWHDLTFQSTVVA